MLITYGKKKKNRQFKLTPGGNALIVGEWKNLECKRDSDNFKI